MGDVGYLDEQDRFWFCGRKAHRVVTAERTYFSIPCEAIFNRHPKVYRSALANSPIDYNQEQNVVSFFAPLAFTLRTLRFKFHRKERRDFAKDVKGQFVSISSIDGSKRVGLPRMFIEPLPEYFPKSEAETEQLLKELRELGQSSPLTESITEIRLLRSFPVDVRHNVKINREWLATLR